MDSEHKNSYHQKLASIAKRLSETPPIVTNSATRFLNEIVDHALKIEEIKIGENANKTLGEYLSMRVFLTYKQGIQQEAYSLAETERASFIKSQYDLTETELY